MRPRAVLPAASAVVAAVAAVVLAGCSSSASQGNGSTISTPGPSASSGPSSSSSTTPSAPASSSASSPASSTTTASPSGSASSPTSSSATTSPPVGPGGGPVPHGFVPTSATFVSSDDGWVLGTAPCATSPCTSIVRTRDGGRTWVGIPAPKATLGDPFNGRDGQVGEIRFATQTDGWAGVGSLYSTHDGGAHWTAVHVEGLEGAVASIATGGGYVYVASDGCPSQGGNACSQTSRVFASPIGKDDFAPVSPTLHAGGSSGLVLHGAQWWLPTTAGLAHGDGPTYGGLLPSACPTSDPTATIAVADSQHLDAFCLVDGGAGMARYQLYGTTNGAKAWTKAGPVYTGASGLTGLADNGKGVLLAAVASGGSYLLRTTDDGQTFHMADVTAPSGGDEWADLGFTTSTRAIAVLTTKGFYISNDSGQSFSKVAFS